jgi:hypothetical protein
VDDIRSAQLPAFEVKPQIAQQMQQQKLAAFRKICARKPNRISGVLESQKKNAARPRFSSI